MSLAVVGTGTLRVMRSRRRWQRGIGWVNTYSAQGTPADINGLLPSLMSQYDTIDISPQEDGVMDRVDATYGDGTAAQQWEMDDKVAEVDLLSTDDARLKMADDVIKLVRDTAENSSPSATDIATISASPVALEYYRLLILGQKTVVKFTPVLILTENFADSYTANWSLVNVGKVILGDAQAAYLGYSGSIANLEGIPSDVHFTLPNDVSTRTGPTLVYGWFKSHPKLRRTSWGRWSREQTWEYNLWPVQAYDTIPALPKLS